MNLSHAAERMVMSQPLWWVVMGLEMVLHVVHGPTLEKLLQLEWAALHNGLNERSMRPNRPQKDALLHRTFDIDAEANLLDLIEADVDHTGSVRTVLEQLDHGADLMLELIVWASIGRWEVWEGRAFLYLEVALDRTFGSIEDLYLEAVWDELGAAVTRRTPREFADQVVLDWMGRRKMLGETLDEARDPRILPTMQNHTHAAKALHQALDRIRTDRDLIGILGREHLPAEAWGHGAWNIGTLLSDGVPPT